MGLQVVAAVTVAGTVSCHSVLQQGQRLSTPTECSVVQGGQRQDVHCGTGRTVGDYGSAGGQPKGNAAVPEQAMPMARAADKGASWDKAIGTGWQRGMER